MAEVRAVLAKGTALPGNTFALSVPALGLLIVPERSAGVWVISSPTTGSSKWGCS